MLLSGEKGCGGLLVVIENVSTVFLVREACGRR